MADKSELFIYEEQVVTVGQDIFIDSTAENNSCVVFEDDTDTGYFYAVDRNSDLAVLDGLHIYNVASVTEKNKPLTLRILRAKMAPSAF